MTYMTQEEYQSAFAGWSLMQEKLNQFAKDYIESFGSGAKSEYINRIDINGNCIEIETESYSCGCCGPDCNSYYPSIEYLWSDWKVTEKAARDEKNRLRAEEEKRKKEAEVIAEKERRRKYYESLKKEFEAS